MKREIYLGIGGFCERQLTSHVGIIRAATTFWRDPIDVLVRVLDVASLAVDAVLRVDLEIHLASIFIL